MLACQRADMTIDGGATDDGDAGVVVVPYDLTWPGV
jgi:hypothetical protein